MHAERTDCPRTVPAIEAERTLMMVLLSGEHEPWSRSELEHEIAGIGGDSHPVTDAIRELHGAGLLHITGELVTPSRAVRKMDELSDGAIWGGETHASGRSPVHPLEGSAARLACAKHVNIQECSPASSRIDGSQCAGLQRGEFIATVDAIVNLAPGLGVPVAELFDEQSLLPQPKSRADYTHQGCPGLALYLNCSSAELSSA